MAHVSESKKKELVDLTRLLKQSKVIGLIDLTNYPSSMLQKLKSDFRNRFEVKVSKKSLMERAFQNTENEKKGIMQLKDMLDKGIPALMLTNDDPFKLSKILGKNKIMTLAKAGQISPSDITVKAGVTSFPPGPVIGEFGSAGLKTAIEAGKIAIKEDKLFVKKGEAITAKQADILGKLGIEPIEVSVKIIGMFENGNVYDNKVLDINEASYINSMKLAGQESFNLAINTTYMTKETIGWLIKKACLESLAISNKTNINDNGG